MILNLLGIIISVLITNFIFFDFFETIYDYKQTDFKNRPIRSILPTYLIVSVLIILINLLHHPLLNLTANFLILNFISYIHYKVPSMRHMILMNTFFFIFIVLIDIIMNPIVARIFHIANSSYIQSEFDFFVGTVLYCILLLSSYRFIKQFLHSNKVYIESKHKLILSIFLPLLSIIIVYQLILNKEYTSSINNFISVFICIGLIFLNIYLVKLFEITYRNNELLSCLKIKDELAKIQLSYYKNLSNKNLELNHHIHDTKRHIQMIETLYETQQPMYAKNYITSIYKEYEAASIHYKSKNIVLEILINDKINKLKEHGIDLIIDDSGISLSFLSDIDIVTIFSNLIDNSFDAVKECNDKKILVTLNTYNSFTYINVQNFYKNVSKDSKGYFRSTKNNHSGFGLNILENVVKKYDGTITTTSTTKIFFVNILFPHL